LALKMRKKEKRMKSASIAVTGVTAARRSQRVQKLVPDASEAGPKSCGAAKAECIEELAKAKTGAPLLQQRNWRGCSRPAKEKKPMAAPWAFFVWAFREQKKPRIAARLGCGKSLPHFLILQPAKF
jgi:hypothetical protein